ncbi:hypothetical protein JW865_00505 [Candidatus Bathyarchaeota archaeon]|nr:hypothetical protein [Candidatus Bathyarchaeota archaeon]
MKRYMILASLILVSIIVPAGIYALQNSQNNQNKNVEDTALVYLKNSPTFKFDGILESVELVECWQAQTFAYPSFWQVSIEFECAHAGYGDRTGQFLAQVITPHKITIHVTEGEITMAVIDDIWDEIAQKMIKN